MDARWSDWVATCGRRRRLRCPAPDGFVVAEEEPRPKRNMPNCPTLSAIASQSELATRKRAANQDSPYSQERPHAPTKGGFISFSSDLLGLALSSGPDGPQDQSYQEPSHSRDKKGWRQKLLPGVRHGQTPWVSDLLLDISQEQATWVGDPQVVPDRHETVPYLRVSLSPDCDCTGGPAR
jgi:hypothetical protein